MKHIVVLALVGCFHIHMPAQINMELVGVSTDASPWFRYVDNFNMYDDVFVAIDPLLNPEIEAMEVEIFVVLDKNESQWDGDPMLTDVTPGGQASFLFSGAGIQDNVFYLTESYTMFDNFSPLVGDAYDIVVDMNGDGLLSPGDFIDGLQDVGMYVIQDITMPGPYAVVTADETSSDYLTKRIWYPENIEELDDLPLVVISHGWTHEYTYYDYLGTHMASYGYIVMAHRNDVGMGNAAGTQSASLSLIANVDDLIANQSTLFGGVLNGKMDTERMAWIGHSTGGETPVRAYTRLRNGENSSPYFGWEDIRVISSICPVAWFSADVVNPYDVNYHQFLGGADTDASGFAGDGYYQPLTIFERATGNRQLTYIHGAGHEVFHGFDSSDTWPDSLAQGPDLVSKAQVHKVVKAYFLALCDLYVKENQGARELFTRPYEDFHPYGIDPVMTITNEFRDALFAPRLVIDDFQTSFQPETASSGASVSMTVSEYYEVLMQDTDGSFSYDPGQPSNGMTRARFDDDPRCAVFAWSNAASLEYAPAFADQDFSSWDFLSFRACQLTRHPENDLLDGDIEFTVQLTDGNGNTSQLALSEYGKIKQTYQRDEGGELHLCLPDGVYEVIVGGTAFPSETFFEIPGYISYSTTGVYEFTIADGDSCTNVDIYMYDEYGDGWDDGELILLDENADTIAVGSLLGGLGPEPGEGWQNEFITVRIPLQEFLLNGTNLDLSDITMLSFLFGGTNGSQRGAIGLDDIELVQNNLIVSSVPATPDNILSGMRIYPNPSTSWIRFDFPTDRKVVSTEICDITGKVVATFQGLPNHWQIPSTWQSGVYIVRCTGDSFVVATRFIYAP